MHSARQRAATAAVAIAVLAAGVAFTLAARAALFPGDPDVDCDSYAFPTDRWRAALRTSGEEALTRRLARNVVRCKLVLGKTKREVRALLGAPNSDLVDGSPRRHREWEYDVGISGGYSDNETISLFMEFGRGRVVYMTAPARRPGGEGDNIRAGAPVGGGHG